jgi:hypothetical protein
MATKPDAPEPFSLKRWSRRKLDGARAADEAPAPVPAPSPPAAPADLAAPAAVAPLPPVESLTIDSDFRAFMQPKVDESLKRAALKQLFSDPHFNVMDGLDTYIDDYSRPDPIPPEMLERLLHSRHTRNPPDPVAAAPTGPPASVAADNENANLNVNADVNEQPQVAAAETALPAHADDVSPAAIPAASVPQEPPSPAAAPAASPGGKQ